VSSAFWAALPSAIGAIRRRFREQDYSLVPVVVGIAALFTALSAALSIADTRGPQFDVVLGPIDPATELAWTWVTGTVSGAVAVFCAIRVWTHFRKPY
jgi:hypothetical protein